MKPRYEELKRDRELGAMLSGVSGEAPVSEVDWPALRSRIHGHATPVLVLRRRSRRRRTWVVATAAAASVAMLLTVSRPPEHGVVELPTRVVQGLTVDDILTSDATDEELRALLAGAGDADALLLLAAAESDL